MNQDDEPSVWDLYEEGVREREERDTPPLNTFGEDETDDDWTG